MPFAYNIRVLFVRIIIITHSDRALFNLNALVSSLGTIVPSAYGTMVPRASTRAFKLNSALSLCVIIILTYNSYYSYSNACLTQLLNNCNTFCQNQTQ